LADLEAGVIALAVAVLLARRLPPEEGEHLGSVEPHDKREAIEQTAKQYNITPARRFRIAVMRRQAAEKSDRNSWSRKKLSSTRSSAGGEANLRLAPRAS
jgi:hypothetical protein